MKLFSVIKNDGPGDVLLWKFLGEDFNDNSQLIVAESEEALFVKDGLIVQVFEGGKYSLSTNNFPFLSDLRNKMSDGTSAFNCKVYFVNKIHKLDILWGTDTPIPLRDAEFGFLVGIRANGAYSIQIDQSKKFWVKLIGSNIQAFTHDELSKYFRTAFSMQIKTHLASYMKKMKMTVFDMATEYNEIAQDLTPVLQDIMDEYGIRLVNFYLNSISVPEDDPNYQAINQAYQRKAEITIQGKDWARISSKELLKDVANNPGSGGLAGAGAGLGMGIAAGGAMGNLAKQMYEPMTESEEHDFLLCNACKSKNRLGAKFCNECGEKLMIENWNCKHCGARLKENSKFCDECGEKVGGKDE